MYQCVYVGPIVKPKRGSLGFDRSHIFVPKVSVFGLYFVEADQNGVNDCFDFDGKLLDDHLEEIKNCGFYVSFLDVLGIRKGGVQIL